MCMRGSLWATPTLLAWAPLPQATPCQGVEMWYMAPAREKKPVVWINIESNDDPLSESEHECPHAKR
jgi:hypothetical protein